MKVAVLGAGSWGTAIAGIVGTHTDVVLWARDASLAATIDSTRVNPRYLPAHVLPPSVRATPELSIACSNAAVVLVAVPSHGFRGVLQAAADSVAADSVVVSLAKGIEQSTLSRMTEVVADVLSDHPTERIGVLTGPNLVGEVAAGQPTATVVAMEDPAVAMLVQELCMTPSFRVYTNPDVVGCEAAGALKNVIALAAGVAAGLGIGDNAMAALVTRGLAELARLGVALGGQPLTFAGLAGMGDLVATCCSPHSRNRHVGFELGRGRALADILAETTMVAEGVRTTKAVLDLAERHGVDVPISRAVGGVLYEGRDPAASVLELMMREAKPELLGS